MKPVVIARTKDMTEEQFREHRHGFIGASDVGAITGHNRWSSAIEVWMEKTGRSEPKEESEAMYWGKTLEDTVAKEFARRNNVKVSRLNSIYVHPDTPWIAATPDRKVNWEGHWAVLECKTGLSPYAARYWDELDGDIPPSYMLQVQQQLYVMGWDVGFLAVLLAGPTYREFMIERDEKLIKAMVKIETDFWELVQSDTPPAHDAQDLSLSKALFPHSEEKSVMTNDPIRVFSYYVADQIEKKAKAAKEQNLALIVNEMQDADTLYVPGVEDAVLTYKETETTRVDIKSLEADHPDLVAPYKKTTTSRRLSLKKKVIEAQTTMLEAARNPLQLQEGGVNGTPQSTE